MSSPGELYRFVLVFLLSLVLMQGVSGWDVQNLEITPSKEPISPQSPVTVTFTVHFDSWLTGLTFPSQDTLDLYTDLADARWVVTRTDIITDQSTVTTPVVTKQGLRVRLDGWTLSYTQRQIDLNVQLQGVAPNVTQSQDITIIRVQEWTPDGQPISDTTMSKKYQIYLPTPTPTTAPPVLTTTPTQTEIVQNTETLATSVTPTKKQTYTPGPEPLLISGMLAVIVLVAAMKREK